jgi:hypothetical protein
VITAARKNDRTQVINMIGPSRFNSGGFRR